MHSFKSSLRRIPIPSRPLRPPNGSPGVPWSRHFTQRNQPPHIAAHAVFCMQLPLLRPTSLSTVQRTGNISQTPVRPFFTVRREWWKEQARVVLKTAIYSTILVSLFLTIQFGVEEETKERKYPTPPDWRFWTRKMRRDAIVEERESLQFVDWVLVGHANRRILERLEDFENDGIGLKEQDEGGIFVPGVGKAGYDITEMSEHWRDEYFDVLMSTAKAAENMDTWVEDKVVGSITPKQFMIGPSNPYPQPLPGSRTRALKPPLEENCQPAFNQPDEFYVKILTTKGFTNGQRTAAAIGYADWFAYKKLDEAAYQMYLWALDIASAGLPSPSDTIDLTTGVLRANAPKITPNIIDATTALAIHYAHRGDLASALPIFLSVLRARRAAPTLARPPPPPLGDKDPQEMPQFWAIFTSPKVRRLRASGDEPLTRGPTAQCEDSRIMNYIGEILFASAPKGAKNQKLAGLEWAREGSDAAEGLAKDRNNGLTRPERKRCRTCAEMGLTNLSIMMKEMALIEKEAKESFTPSRWWGWLGKGGKDVSEGNPRFDRVARWESEAKAVEMRKGNMMRDAVQDLIWANRNSQQGNFVG